MALETYTSLKADIAGFLNKTNLTTIIPTFIRLFEAQANRVLDTRQMVRSEILNLTYEGYPLPDRFGGVRSFRIEGSPATPLNYAKPEEFDSAFGAGRPTRYTLTNRIVLDPVPDATYAARLRYRELLEPLSEANPTNWLLQHHPDAYLYGALMHAAPYLRDDERLPVWARLADLEAINADDRRQSYPSTLNARTRSL